MNIMRHKGYTARIEYSEEDDCFVGHLTGINDIVGFHGQSVSELRTAFKEAVTDYLDTCQKSRKDYAAHTQPPNPYTLPIKSISRKTGGDIT